MSNYCNISVTSSLVEDARRLEEMQRGIVDVVRAAPVVVDHDHAAGEFQQLRRDQRPTRWVSTTTSTLVGRMMRSACSGEISMPL